MKEKKPTPFLARMIAKMMIDGNKHITNLMLSAVRPYKKDKTVQILNNISYNPRHKLCKYDIFKLYDIPETEKRKTVFFIHGGSFCGGDKSGYGRFCTDLAKLGYIVVNINYRLIPQVDIEHCMRDCQKAILHALRVLPYINPDQIFLVGDSAGASLSAHIAINNANRTKNKINIRGVGLYYGVYQAQNVKGILGRYLIAVYRYSYAHLAFKDFLNMFDILPKVNKSFPPCFITSGESDILHCQSVALDQHIEKLGINHKTLLYKRRFDGKHGFLNLARLKTAKESFTAMTSFFETLLEEK